MSKRLSVSVTKHFHWQEKPKIECISIKFEYVWAFWKVAHCKFENNPESKSTILQTHTLFVLRLLIDTLIRVFLSLKNLYDKVMQIVNGM